MIKKLNSILCKSVENTDLKETQLSIQINLDGFSFCIYKLPQKEPIAFELFEFKEKATTPEKHLEEFTQIFENSDLLNQSFQKVTVIHQNELATLVPDELFDQNNLRNYIERSVKILDFDFITFDDTAKTKTNTVYVPFVNINNFLFNKYGSFEYFHMFSKLGEFCFNEDSKNSKEKMFLHVNSSDFELLAYKNNVLQAINLFKFQTAEDFIYYVLFIVEQFDLDVETLQLTLLGAIEQESELYEILYKYIREIYFFSNNEPSINQEFNGVSKHSYFLLLNN